VDIVEGLGDPRYEPGRAARSENAVVDGGSRFAADHEKRFTGEHPPRYRSAPRQAMPAGHGDDHPFLEDGSASDATASGGSLDAYQRHINGPAFDRVEQVFAAGLSRAARQRRMPAPECRHDVRQERRRGRGRDAHADFAPHAVLDLTRQVLHVVDRRQHSARRLQ